MPVKPPKPKQITIVSVKRTRKTIKIAWKQGDSDFSLNERDNPLRSFNEAIDALPAVVGSICHLSAPYCGEGMRVVSFHLGEQGGAATVSLNARKDISDAAKEFAFTTPERPLATPTEPGKYSPTLDKADAALVEEAIEQAKLYVCGERAQGQIEFKGDDDDDDGSGEEPAKGAELPLGDGQPAEPDDLSGSQGKPARKRGAVRGRKKK